MGLTINREIHETTIILKFKGILDISTANVMDPYLDEIQKINTLVLDFSELEFIDSTGIGSIINSIYLSQEKNFYLELKGINELTHQVFETIGVYHILNSIQKEVV
ncbi:STAS domain-containing protein [Bacillus sp. ISL-45]|uniref:STAS domain-containing protein n=1 Tax=Bacillus sp. ISL-45 TaxID=2819128 RepID=UPI001BEAF028|nr:STAS domain-containing protein [Bacillus sp. ISL-45]MBT2663864.1 STAS domain-containing protein [Bacillus sp. ISL-45]